MHACMYACFLTLSEGVIAKVDADLGDGQLLGGESRQHTDRAGPRHLHQETKQ
jgi:hypothetical protein